MSGDWYGKWEFCDPEDRYERDREVVYLFGRCYAWVPKDWAAEHGYRHPYQELG